MTVDHSIISYFIAATPVIKIVLLLLASASIFSWIFIFQRGFYFRWLFQQTRQFENKFNSASNLLTLYEEVSKQNEHAGLEKIFSAGFKEFMRLHKLGNTDIKVMKESVNRVMRVAQTEIMHDLETHLSFLATVGSTSPYVGLFGTVWGIMTAFQALGNVEQATISMVAPGISEALIATALGLFAAIPAVIAYNRYNHQSEYLLDRYEIFQETFLGFLERQWQTKK